MTQTETWTVGRLIQWTVDYLKKHGSESPRLDAEVLLAHARKCQRIDLYTAFGEEPSEDVRSEFRALIKQRAEGKPVAYLVGTKEFFSLPFHVTSDVLIPRPETEHLIVAAIDCAKRIVARDNNNPPSVKTEPVPTPTPDDAPTGLANHAQEPSVTPAKVKNFPIQIADLGTGSGCIAITLAKQLPGSRIVAIDQSKGALNVARENATRLGVAPQVEFFQGDWLSSIPDSTRFDLICSNPPYISQAEYDALPLSVRNFEPKSALLSGPTGTEDPAKIIEQARSRLKPGGYLLLEISPMIADKVQSLFDSLHWENVQCIRDLSQHQRVVLGRLKLASET